MEAIKLSTTRSPWVSGLVVAVLSLGTAALIAVNTSDSAMSVGSTALVVIILGVPVLMIVAALTITGEYRHGVIRTTFAATPNRTLVLCAKAVVTAVFAGVFAAVMVIASIVLALALANDRAGAGLSLLDASTWRAIGAIALYAALAAVLAVGLGAVLRHAVAVVAVLLLTLFALEPALILIPSVSEHAAPLLPFRNAYNFIGMVDESLMWWGPWGSLLYFTGIVAAVFLAGVFVINRVDP